MTTLSPSQDDIQAVLRTFILGIMPSGTEVFLGQANRVSEPETVNFVVFTPISRTRLRTNIDTFADCFFDGYISGTTLNVNQINYGEMVVGAPVYGSGVIISTTVIQFLTGTGGAGTYLINPPQVVSPTVMAAGTMEFQQGTEIVFQLDFHSNDMGVASDMAETFTTLFRSDYGVTTFTALNPYVTPLYSEDPKQVPFINDQEQYEDRWIVEAHVQADQTVSGLPQQYADVLAIKLVEVNSTYPPS